METPDPWKSDNPWHVESPPGGGAAVVAKVAGGTGGGDGAVAGPLSPVEMPAAAAVVAGVSGVKESVGKVLVDVGSKDEGIEASSKSKAEGKRAGTETASTDKAAAVYKETAAVYKETQAAQASKDTLPTPAPRTPPATATPQPPAPAQPQPQPQPQPAAPPPAKAPAPAPVAQPPVTPATSRAAPAPRKPATQPPTSATSQTAFFDPLSAPPPQPTPPPAPAPAVVTTLAPKPPTPAPALPASPKVPYTNGFSSAHLAPAGADPTSKPPTALRGPLDDDGDTERRNAPTTHQRATSSTMAGSLGASITQSPDPSAPASASAAMAASVSRKYMANPLGDGEDVDTRRSGDSEEFGRSRAGTRKHDLDNDLPPTTMTSSFMSSKVAIATPGIPAFLSNAAAPPPISTTPPPSNPYSTSLSHSTSSNHLPHLPPTPVPPSHTVSIPSTTRVPGVDSHISYTVVSRPLLPTGAPARPGVPDAVVGRRYRDFAALERLMVWRYPGVIVPPVPEKQALGRFQEEFVEFRRLALEKFLRKSCSHPYLRLDPDLRTFLESESWSADAALGKIKTQASSASSGGLWSNLAVSAHKQPEGDEWFEARKIQVEILGTQLRALYRAVEGVVKQRKDLGMASLEFGESLVTMSGVEMDRQLVNNLAVLGEICKKMREMQLKQARIDVTTLANTVDEYVRLLASVDAAFASRLRVHGEWRQAEAAMLGKRAAMEKAKAGRARPEKVNQLQGEIDEAETVHTQAKKEYEEATERLRGEITRFDREKVEDFMQALQQFLEGMLQTQKEVVALWESYFTLTRPTRTSRELQ